jgi:hypothetical protein
MTADPVSVSREDTTRRAVRSTATVFALAGVAISSLLSRVPQIRDALHLSPRSLGLLLLMTAVGSLVSLPLSGTTCPVMSRSNVVLPVPDGPMKAVMRPSRAVMFRPSKILRPPTE